MWGQGAASTGTHCSAEAADRPAETVAQVDTL